MSSIHDATRHGDLERLKALIDAGAVLDEVDEDDSTALDYALRGQSPAVLEHLLSLGAHSAVFENPLGLYALDSWTPAMLKAMAGHLELGLPKERPLAPLHEAVEASSEVAVKILLAHGANPEVRSRLGKTALEMALELHESRCAQLLKP